MGLEQRPLRTVRIDYRCDDCGEGLLKHIPQKTTVTPLQSDRLGRMIDLASSHLHKCPVCHHHFHLKDTYPKWVYVPEGEMADLTKYEA